MMAEPEPSDEELYSFLKRKWLENPRSLTAEDYEKGCAFAIDGEITFKPWPKGSDMPHFGLTAAKAMLAEDSHAFPLDVSEFAFYLRHVFILTALNLPVDPESRNIVRHFEKMIAEREGPGMDANRVIDAVAAFCLIMGKAKTPGQLSVDEKEAFLKAIRESGKNDS